MKAKLHAALTELDGTRVASFERSNCAQQLYAFEAREHLQERCGALCFAASSGVKLH